MNFDLYETEHRRLAILKLLQADAGYAANDSVIQSAMRVYGFNASRDRIRNDLRWLEEQELVSVNAVASLLVATIRQRGLDAADGVASVEGVRRPSPAV